MDVKCNGITNVWKRGCRRQKRHALLGVMMLSVLMTGYWWVMLKSYVPPQQQSVNLRIYHDTLKDTIEEEQGSECQMPYLDPFSNEAMAYLREVPKLVCKGNDWVECVLHECFVKEEIHNVMKNIVCTYRDILYVNDRKYTIGEPIKVSGRDTYKLNRSDLVKISCTGKEIESLGLVPSRWFGNKAGLRPLPTPKPTDKLNVMILCFDSASHNGFIRKMPKTYKYLTEVLNSVVLDSYNIVGDGTPYAIFPLMTGRIDVELPDTRISIGSNTTIDPEEFLFKALEKEGYRTAYFEDAPRTGTFNYKYNGFSSQPAHHYLRPLFLEDSTEVTWWFGVENDFCIGSVPHFEFMINLTKQVYQLDGDKFTFTFISDICHDDFNYITWADEAVVDFLSWMKGSGRLEDTLMIVMGDHGVRFGSYRNTFQGKLEERLPFMSIILPEKLKKLRPEALEALVHNRDVLTTPFDIHTTILDVLGMVDKANGYVVPGADMPRGMSLLKPIPKTRTCGKAAVVPYYCACTKWYNITKSNPIYEKIGNSLANYIDSLTEEVRSLCASRKLVSIQWIQRQTLTEEILKDIQSSILDSENYQAKIIMSPGDGMYEGFVKYFVASDQFSVSLQDISKVNAINDQPHCISATHPHLTNYCFCKDKL